MERAQLRGVVAARAGAHAPYLQHRDPRPWRSSRSAVVSPTMPAPSTATSTVRSRSSGLAPAASRPGTRVSRSRADATRFAPPPHRGIRLALWDAKPVLCACLLALGAGRVRHGGPRARRRGGGRALPRRPRDRRRPGGLRRAQPGDRLEARAAGEEAMRGGDPDARAPEGRHRGGHARVRDERVRPRSPRAAPTSSTRLGAAGGSRPPAASPPRPSSPTTASWRTEMRAMFVVYLFLIISGIRFFTAIGLMHN